MKQSMDAAAKWAKLIKGYTQLETLDAQTLLLLIGRIEIGDEVLSGGRMIRNVRILYNYLGDIADIAIPVYINP